MATGRKNPIVLSSDGDDSNDDIIIDSYVCWAGARKFCIDKIVYNTVKSGGKLNDNVIDFALFKEYDTWCNSFQSKVALFSSFFWSNLKGVNKFKATKSEKRDKKLKQATKFEKNIDNLSTKKYIIFPMCQYKHWTLAIINNCDNLIFIIDSTQKSEFFYRDEFKDIKLWLNYIANSDADYTNYVPEAPKQQNGVDCGVFVVKNLNFFAEKTSGGASVKFFKQITNY